MYHVISWNVYMTLLQWVLLIGQAANLQLIVVGQCLALISIPVNIVAKNMQTNK